MLQEGVFSAFGFELKNLPEIKVRISNQSGERGNAKDIIIGKKCSFLKGKSCTLDINQRVMDCLTYPFYPFVDYKEGKFPGFYVHKSCPFHNELLNEKFLLDKLKRLWGIQFEKRVSFGDLRDWVGNDDYEFWKDFFNETIKVYF